MANVVHQSTNMMGVRLGLQRERVPHCGVVVTPRRRRMSEIADARHLPDRLRISETYPDRTVSGPVVLAAMFFIAAVLLAPAPSLAKSVKYTSDLNVSSYIAQVPEADPPFKAAKRSDEELLILQMTLGKLILRDAVFGYPKQGSLILPLTEVVDALEFPITVDAENGRAQGWFLSESRLFSLDLAAGKVVIAGEVRPVDPAFVEQLPDDIYVDVRTLATWFPVDFNYDIPNLILNIEPREALPIQTRLEREQRRQRIFAQRRGGDGKQLPKLEVPYQWISWPVSDTTLDFTVTSSDEGPTLSRSYTTLATADIAKLNADFFISGNQDEQINVARVKLGRQRAEGGLLGKLDATKFAVGDVYGPQIAHMTRTKVGRGFTISNAPIGDEREFDRITLQGDLQLGWEVELYRNEVLLDFRQSQDDGRYLFEDVPLLFGVNVLKLKFYGPQGQVREEVQQIRVGPDQIKPGGHTYGVSFNQQDRLTLTGDDDDDNTDGFQGKSRYTAQYKYGVSKNLSIGANLASIPFEGGHNVYLGSNVVTSLGPVYLRTDITKDVAGGWAGTVSGQTQLFGVSVLGEHTILNDFLSEEYDNETDPLTSESRLRLDGAIRSDFLPQIPYAFNVSHENAVSGDKTTTFQNRLSTAVGRASVSNTLNLTLNDPAETADTETASGTFQLGGSIGDVRTRGQIGYNVLPEFAVSTVALSGDWKVTPKLNARAGITKELTGTQLTSYTAGLNSDFDIVAAGIEGQYDDAGDYSAKLKLTYSWGKDAADGGLRVASKATAERGTMTAMVFRDLDGDGTFTEGVDEPLKDVGFKSGRTRLKQKTNNEGRAFITSLDTYEPVNFEIDQATLIDPYWTATPDGVEVTLRPGVPGHVDFAVVTTGEIDGIVYQNDGQWSKPVKDVIIQLLDKDGDIVREVQSQYDGFYLVEFIRPGTYTLRVDPEQLTRLELPDVAPRTVEIGQDGTVLNGEDFVIGEAAGGKLEARVLLASFNSVDDARKAWEEIRSALPDVFEDIIAEFPETPATNEKASFVDLYALPFPSREAAEDACIELRAQFGDTYCNPLDISIK